MRVARGDHRIDTNGLVFAKARGDGLRIADQGGVLYPQRISDMTKFGFIEALFPDSPLALEAE